MVEDGTIRSHFSPPKGPWGQHYSYTLLETWGSLSPFKRYATYQCLGYLWGTGHLVRELLKFTHP